MASDSLCFVVLSVLSFNYHARTWFLLFALCPNCDHHSGYVCLWCNPHHVLACV